jgi:DNA-binding transcriptional ArsR family regulator
VSNRPEPIDQRLVRALSHPLRVQILEVLTERIASPNWLSEQLEANLSHVAYHTRTLDRCGCLDLVDTAQRRGATEHFYKAVPGSFVGDRGWRRVPHALLGGVSGASLQTFMDKAIAALEAGTLDGREDTVLSWMPLLVDEAGWGEVVAILEDATDLILAAQERSDDRLADPGARRGAISAVVSLAGFEAAGSRPT